MQITEWRYFEGPNPHCHRPILELCLDLGDLAEVSTAHRPHVATNLLKHLPGLSNHYCGLGFQGGFALRLREGTLFGHVLEHVALELLHLAGFEGTYGKTRQVRSTSVYRIAFEAPEEEVGRAAADLSLRFLDALLYEREFQLEEERGRLLELYARRCLGPSTEAIARAARARDIPVRRLAGSSVLELGQGQYLRRVQATLTDRTSTVAVDIAQDKQRCKAILREHGIPVPEGIVVRTAEQAAHAALRLPLPLVVKPVSGSQGRGVSVHLRRPRDVRRAVAIAQAISEEVLLERQIFGKEYRLLVVGGRFVAAAERIPPAVVGDGEHTVAELVAFENLDPRRGGGHERPLTRITLDNIAHFCLARQGLLPDGVPQPGQRVLLRDSANLSTGGTARDCTDEVSPRVRAMAERAAAVIGLDVAGIDVVAQDIADDAAPAWVLEVNAAPGIRMHLYPQSGHARDVAGSIVESLFPPGSPSRIPLAAVTGSNGKTTTVRLVREMLQRRGLVVGFTSTDGHGVGDEFLGRGDDAGPRSARAVLSDQRVQAAVLEVARGGISRAGLGYDAADVGCILNVTGDHLGQDGTDTIEELAQVKALVIEAVRPHGRVVLNADDPVALQLGSRARAPIVLFSASPDHLAVRRHIAAGGEAVIAAQDAIVLFAKGRTERIAQLRELAFADAGRVRPMLENALAAAALGHGLGLLPEEIAEGLRSFRNDAEHNPGRMNVYDVHGVRVVVDYGHNPHALAAVGQSLRAVGAGRLRGVIGMPGDRRDEDALALGRVAAQVFDEVFCKEDRDRRGRERGDMALRIAQGVRTGGGRPSVVLDECEALREAFQASVPGDVVAVFYELLGPVLEEIERLRASQPATADAVEQG
ncbi:MAG: cyanophycin synthetase [Thermaerobacter sp.]|nr:cyanophycin synthetase [Thermaerobacter sp.]